jgi:glycosyltransferase involved in cell wall biosynthesis
LGKLYSPFRKVFWKSTDRIIATSPNYIQTSNVLKDFKDKCTVIPLGIDIERFSSNKDTRQTNQIKGKYGNKTILLFVGRFRHYKGLNFLISAMKEIDAHLLLIGTGPEEQRLHNMVEKNHLGNKIFFLGELSDDEVNAYYKACDIFILPSHLRSEAFGLVQLEAMCCRKPVISTELGTGTSFVNINQETGLTVEPNNVKSLVTAIKYLKENPEKRIEFGECAHKRVLQLFTADRMVESTLKLYENLISETNRTQGNRP